MPDMLHATILLLIIGSLVFTIRTLMDINNCRSKPEEILEPIKDTLSIGILLHLLFIGVHASFIIYDIMESMPIFLKWSLTMFSYVLGFYLVSSSMVIQVYIRWSGGISNRIWARRQSDKVNHHYVDHT